MSGFWIFFMLTLGCWFSYLVYKFLRRTTKWSEGMMFGISLLVGFNLSAILTLLLVALLSWLIIQL